MWHGTTRSNGPRSMAKVSVIIPTYQRAELLVRAVKSCLDQSMAVHEVLVCDDGSTDDSRQRIDALADPRVIWLPGPHTGRPAPARNRGVAAATGDWLAFLDSDDAWLPGKLEAQLAQIDQTGLGACCTNAERIGPDGRSLGPYFTAAPGTIDLAGLLHVNGVICSSALVKTALVREVGGFPEQESLKALEDYALWLRIATRTSFAWCGELLMHYTDAPATSLRAGPGDVHVQRDLVFTDLLQWGAQHQLDRRHRRRIVRHLRYARRKAGRPLAQWLFPR